MANTRMFVGIGGMLLLSFIVAYVFGREHAEGTAKNRLALPVARPLFALAKFVVTAAWWLVLVAAVLAEAFVIGTALGLPDFAPGLALTTGRNVRLAAGIRYLLVPVVAWMTLLGRGYLAPLGFTLAMPIRHQAANLRGPQLELSCLILAGRPAVMTRRQVITLAVIRHNPR